MLEKCVFVFISHHFKMKINVRVHPNTINIFKNLTKDLDKCTYYSRKLKRKFSLC